MVGFGVDMRRKFKWLTWGVAWVEKGMGTDRNRVLKSNRLEL